MAHASGFVMPMPDRAEPLLPARLPETLPPMPPIPPSPQVSLGAVATGSTAASSTTAPAPSSEQLGSASQERASKRQRMSSISEDASATQPLSAIFGGVKEGSERLYLGATTATVEWRIDDFQAKRRQADGVSLDGPKFGPREPWQIFCHPDGRCYNQPQGGPPGVFLRYLGSYERVPAYATIEKLQDGEFRVPENNARDAPFVVLFGRNEIEEWGVCKDFGLFDDAFGQTLSDGALVLRARVTWVEPRADSLLPREVVSVRQSSSVAFPGAAGSLQADLAQLWNARRPTSAARSQMASGGPVSHGPSGVHCGSVPPSDLVLICENQRFEVDRAVLAARSSFFGAMLSNGQYREAGQREVPLPDVSAQALAAALRFAYTDEGPEKLTREDAEELLVVSSKLGISGLQNLCSNSLRDHWLTMQSAVSLLRLADEHGATSLRTEALAVLAMNFDQVKVTSEWEELLHSGMNPALIQDAMQALADASIFAGRASIKL